MGFFNDFIRGATPALPGGMQVGLQGMAEAQRKKELQDEIARQQGQQAFANMMRQREMEQQQQNWDLTRQDQNYNNQQEAIYRDTAFRTGLEQNLVENKRADRLTNAQVSNYAEGRAPSELEFMWNKMTPEEQQVFSQNFIQNKYKPAGAGAAGGLTPSNMISVLNASRPDQFSPADTNTANSYLNWVGGKSGQLQMPTGAMGGDLTPEDQEAMGALQGVDPSQVDWEATMAKYPNLNWQAIMKAMGAK